MIRVVVRSRNEVLRFDSTGRYGTTEPTVTPGLSGNDVGR